MVRIVTCFTVIFLVNAVGVAFAVGGLVLFFIKDDFLISGAFWVPVAVILLIQPWTLAIFGGAYATLAPHLNTVHLFELAFVSSIVSFIIYSWLMRHGWLDRITHRLSWRRVWITVCVYAVLCAILFVLRQYDIPPIHRGVPASVSFIEKQIGAEIASSRYFVRMNFIDREYLWRCELTEEQFALLPEFFKRFGNIACVSASDVPRQFFHHRAYWWSVEASPETVFWATRNFPTETRGGDGYHVIMSYDRGRRVLHAWIKNNF